MSHASSTSQMSRSRSFFDEMEGCKLASKRPAARSAIIALVQSILRWLAETNTGEKCTHAQVYIIKYYMGTFNNQHGYEYIHATLL